jgi:predicted secreted protein
MENFNYTPFPLAMALAIFFTSWWVCLFAVLPFGVKNHEEGAEALPEGADAGSPVAPLLAKKAIATTLLALVVYALVVVLSNVMT